MSHDYETKLKNLNLPGTTDEHPNWRRRMPDTTEALLARPEVARRTAILSHKSPA